MPLQGNGQITPLGVPGTPQMTQGISQSNIGDPWRF